jgi:sugar diacid utilization regulator/GAF domain-containing protein
MYRAAAHSPWPGLIATLLGEPAEDRAALRRVALGALAEAVRADTVELVEWMHGQPSCLATTGERRVLRQRMPAGHSFRSGRPIAVATVGAHRDVVAARRAGAAPFTRAELATVDAIALLLEHADVGDRHDAPEPRQRVTTEIVGTLDLERVLLAVANAASRLLDSETAGVFLVHGGELEIRCAVGHRRVETSRLRIPKGRGVAGKVFATGRPVRVDDYATETSITSDFLGVATDEGTRSALAVPITDADEQVIGVLSVWRRRLSIFTDEDEEQLKGIAALASIGVVNARAYTAQRDDAVRLRRHADELEGRLSSTDQTLQIHRRLTMIAAEGRDLAAVAQSLHRHVGAHIVIVPDRDRPPVRCPEADPGAGPDLPTEQQARGVRELGPADGGDRWLKVPIEAANVRYGLLYARFATRPVQHHVVVLEQAATICALLIGHDEALLAATARLRAELVWDLLEGRASDAADVSHRAVALGYRLAFPARVLLVQACGLSELTRAQRWSVEELDRSRGWLAQRIGDAVGALTGHVTPVAYRGDLLVAIVPQPDRQPDLAGRLGQAATGRSPFPTVTLRAGLSRAVAGAEALPTALRQAHIALSAVNPENGPAVVFDELGVLQFLVAPSGADELFRFADSVLGPLVAYDDRHGTNLVTTVDRYLDSGCNASRAARALHVHPKSLAYRLRRIGEISGLDLSARENRLNMELALRILGRKAHEPAGSAADEW